MPKYFQVIELQLPSFFGDFDPRSAAASLPSSKLTPHPFVVLYEQCLYLKMESDYMFMAIGRKLKFGGFKL